jgi:hypothetical protein
MPEYKRLEDAVEDYLRHRRARGKAVTTVTNETYVRIDTANARVGCSRGAGWPIAAA